MRMNLSKALSPALVAGVASSFVPMSQVCAGGPPAAKAEGKENEASVADALSVVDYADRISKSLKESGVNSSSVQDSGTGVVNDAVTTNELLSRLIQLQALDFIKKKNEKKSEEYKGFKIVEQIAETFKYAFNNLKHVFVGGIIAFFVVGMLGTVAASYVVPKLSDENLEKAKKWIAVFMPNTYKQWLEADKIKLDMEQTRITTEEKRWKYEYERGFAEDHPFIYRFNQYGGKFADTCVNAVSGLLGALTGLFGKLK